MTLPAEGGAAPPTKKNGLLKIALALSVTLNLCFLGGLVYSTYFGPAHMTQAERIQGLAQDISQELNLTPDQHQAFENMVRVMRQKSQEMRDANQALVEQAWDELSRAEADQDKLTQLFTQIADNRRQFQIAVGDAMRQFLGTLSADQRVKIVDLMRHRRSPAPFWRILQP